MTMQVGFFCEECSRYNLYDLPLSEGAGNCEHCSHKEAPQLSFAVARGGPVDSCPHCQNTFFYTRKDFPQQLGCAIVSATVVFSSIAYGFYGFPAALAVLVVITIGDFVLYHHLGELTVCYRCHTELRGFEPSPDHEAFDMHRAEEYEQGS